MGQVMRRGDEPGHPGAFAAFPALAGRACCVSDGADDGDLAVLHELDGVTIREYAGHHTLIVDGRWVHLTPSEHALVAALLARVGRAVTPDALCREAFGCAYAPAEDERLYRHVKRARPKLEAHGLTITPLRHRRGWMLVRLPDGDVPRTSTGTPPRTPSTGAPPGQHDRDGQEMTPGGQATGHATARDTARDTTGRPGSGEGGEGMTDEHDASGTDGIEWTDGADRADEIDERGRRGEGRAPLEAPLEAQMEARRFVLPATPGVAYAVVFRDVLAAGLHPPGSAAYLVVARAGDRATIGTVEMDARRRPALVPLRLRFDPRARWLAALLGDGADDDRTDDRTDDDGANDGVGDLGGPDVGAGTLTVPLPQPVRDALAAWLAEEFPRRVREAAALLAGADAGPDPAAPASESLRAWWRTTLLRLVELAAWEGRRAAPDDADSSPSGATWPAPFRREPPRTHDDWRTWCEGHLAGLVATSTISRRVRWGGEREGGTTFVGHDRVEAVTYVPLALGRARHTGRPGLAGRTGGERRGYLAYYVRRGDPDAEIVPNRMRDDDGMPRPGVRAPGPRSRRRAVVVAWVPPDVAQDWYAERWDAQRGPSHALTVLGRMLQGGGYGLWDDDYYRWVFERVGTNALLATARAAAPVPFRGTPGVAALASKWFRVPVAVTVPLFLGAGGPPARTLVGYGDPTCTRASEAAFYGDGPCEAREGTITADRAALADIAREVRLRGWVPREAEPFAAPDAWPTAEDLLALQAEVHGCDDAWTPGW